MKVGIDARAAKWYRGTGIGTYVFQLINHINKIDSENNYVFFTSEDEKLDFCLGDNIKTNSLSKNMENNFWDEIRIPVILKDEDIDIYHVPQNGIGLPKNKKCPYVITLHDVIPLKKPETVSERYLKIFHEELPELLNLCDGIITVSNYSKKDIAEAFNFPENKIYVTYLAAEDIYKPMDNFLCKSIIKEKYSIYNDFILYVGGFSPRKNILCLIEAYSMLPEKIKNKKSLVIVGNKGASFEKYKKRTEELKIENKVFFPGFIPMEDIPLFYNAADLFVYPSLYEGFGLPPLEAMACGTPVITSKVTAMAEIYENSCIFINPYERDKLRDAIEAVITDSSLRDDLIARGYKKKLEFNWDTTTKSTIAIYKNILKI